MAPDDTPFGTTVRGTGLAGDALREDGELRTGDRVGPYIVRAPLAAGGFGAVYRVEHEVLGRTAALKVLHSQLAGSREYVLRFEQEARAVNVIGHAGIIDIHEFGELPDGRPYFVMEYLDGQGLDAYVGDRGALPAEDALEILGSVAAALAAAHAKGFVHRDVKASNVFLSGDGSDRRVVLLDFGIAKLISEDAVRLTKTGQTLGTPSSMAPEQLAGRAVDSRTDVYGLGALAFFLLCGSPAISRP